MKVVDHSLRLVQRHGVYGRIWLGGCVYHGCLTDLPLTLTMTVSREDGYKRNTSFHFLPLEWPFEVRGLLLLKGNESNVHVRVTIEIGKGQPQELLHGKLLCSESFGFH